MAQPVSARMREANKSIHSRANSLVNAKLIVALSDPAVYGRAIGDFYPVFVALEDACAAHRDSTELGAFSDLWSVLHRADRFKQDLETFLGPSWRSQLDVNPATQRYVVYIEQLAKTDPGKLVVHCYTQYIALCAGGQVIQRGVRQMLKPPEGKGTAIFEYEEEYEEVPPDQLKQWIREAFDSTAEELDETRKQQMVDENIRVFEFNNDIVYQCKLGWRGYLAPLRRLLPGNVLAMLLYVLCCLALASLTGSALGFPSLGTALADFTHQVVRGAEQLLGQMRGDGASAGAPGSGSLLAANEAGGGAGAAGVEHVAAPMHAEL